MRPKARMNAVQTSKGICRTVAEETGRGPKSAGKPRRRGRAGILNEAGALRMLEGSLCFAIVIEAELIDGGVVDRPGMGQVPLLVPLLDGGSKARNVSACCLELGKGEHHAMIVKIIVSAKTLLVVDPVVDLESKLVAAFRLHRGRLYGVAGSWRRHKLQQVHRGCVHATQGNDLVREDG